MEESPDRAVFPTILEEETSSPKSQINNNLDIIKPITPKFADKSNISEPVSLQTIDESLPQTNGDNSPPIVSET